MSSPTDLANVFQQTIAGTTESVKNAQKTLQNLHKDPNFLPNLLLIIKQVNLPVRKAAAVYTKKFAKSQISEKNQTKLNQLAQVLLNQLSISSTDLALRRHIATTLQFILINDQKCIIRNSFNAICIKMLDAAIADDPSINYQFLGFFIQILMSSFVHLTKQSNIFIQKTISNFSKVNLKIFNFAVQAVQEQDKDKIIKIFRVLKIYSFTMKNYIKKTMLAQIQTAKLLYDENITLLLSTSLEYSIKNNELSTSLIFYNSNADQQIIQIFHSIKADYVQGVSQMMRIIMMHFKDKQMITAHLILNSPSLIPSVINALNQIFSKTSYYKIKSSGLVKLIQELISLLIVAVKNIFYFQYFMEYKKIIFQGIILRILGFSPCDCEALSDDPDEFINLLLQIIEMQSVKSAMVQLVFEEKNNQVEQYSNLRTLTSAFLDLFCKHIDGVLPQIITYSVGVLKGQIQSQFPKPLLLLLLCILRDQILQRQNQGNQIVSTVCEIIKSQNFPGKILDTGKTSLQTYEANIEYLLSLLTLYRYLTKVVQVQEQQLLLLGEVVFNLLTNDGVSQVLQYIAFDLIIILCDRQNQYQPKFIKVLLTLITQNKNQIKCLQCLANIITTTNRELQPYGQLIMQTVHTLVKIVISEAEKKTLINQLLVNKCCSVITHICQNPAFIPKLIPQIEQAMMPLLVYIDGKNNFDFEEDILMMMSSFIEKSGVVTQNQLIMFQIIPRLFYSQYQFVFGHSFQTLQVFIFYGSSILSSAPQAVKAIIDMAVTNMNTIQVKNSKRNEAENTDGLLILQSLILSCGTSFTNQIWVQITKAITKRLQNPPVKSHILHSNILATIALILAAGSKAFTNQDCDVLLNRVLQNYYCFVVQYSIKVAIIAFSELLGRYTQPFISNRFTYLLDATITLLQNYKKKQLFDKNPMTDIERDYQVSVLTIKNAIINMNELQNFKDKIKMIKEQNFPFFQQAISQLPETKSNFLKEILNVTIVKNQARKIFKIKK